MKRCTLTLEMWIHCSYNECLQFEGLLGDEECKNCKWYKEI